MSHTVEWTIVAYLARFVTIIHLIDEVIATYDQCNSGLDVLHIWVFSTHLWLHTIHSTNPTHPDTIYVVWIFLDICYQSSNPFCSIEWYIIYPTPSFQRQQHCPNNQDPNAQIHCPHLQSTASHAPQHHTTNITYTSSETRDSYMLGMLLCILWSRIVAWRFLVGELFGYMDLGLEYSPVKSTEDSRFGRL